MSELFGDDFITLEDDDGNEVVLELLDTMDYNNQTYNCFVPADMDENDPDYGLIILRTVMDGSDFMFEDIEDPAELNEVYEKFQILWAAEEPEEQE